MERHVKGPNAVSEDVFRASMKARGNERDIGGCLATLASKSRPVYKSEGMHGAFFYDCKIVKSVNSAK